MSDTIMNAVSLRYYIYKSLIGLASPASIKAVEMTRPVPAELEVTVADFYDGSSPDATRRFRITIEEIA